METAYESEFFELSYDPKQRLLRLARSASPLTDVETLATESCAIEAVLADKQRETHVMMVDARLAPAETDPELYEAMRRFREHVTAGYARVAVLIASHVGRNELLHHADRTFMPIGAFADEEDALQFLLGE